MTSIGARLREERKRLGLSQTQLGELGGVTKKSQMMYEAGSRAPSAQYLASIANAGVDVLYVVTSSKDKGRGSRCWGHALTTVVDELNAANRRIGGAQLLELVDLLSEWQSQGASIDSEGIRKQILLVTQKPEAP